MKGIIVWESLENRKEPETGFYFAHAFSSWGGKTNKTPNQIFFGESSNITRTN